MHICIAFTPLMPLASEEEAYTARSQLPILKGVKITQCTYIYVYTQKEDRVRERESERESERARERDGES